MSETVWQLVARACPDGVPYRKLGEVCEIHDNQRRPVTKSAREKGEYPYYGANGIQDYVSDFIFEGQFVLVGEDGSVITANGNPVVTWAEGKIWVNNHAHVISEKQGVLLRFLFHYLQTIDITKFVHGNIPKFTAKDFKATPIPLPPHQVQREVVRILDEFTTLLSLLRQELAARRKQYAYYRDCLLAFDAGGGSGGARLPAAIARMVSQLCPDGVPYRKLGEVCEIVTGGEPPKDCIKGDCKDNEHPYAIWGNGKDVYGYSSTYRINRDAVTISSIGANTGAIYYRSAYFTPIIRLKVIIPKDNTLLSRYLYHALFVAEIKGKKSTVPNMNAAEIKAIPIPLPPLEVQREVVRILDQFSTLTTSLTAGLPAEIAARRKQYEYYRDKLLSFKRKG